VSWTLKEINIAMWINWIHLRYERRCGLGRRMKKEQRYHGVHERDQGGVIVTRRNAILMKSRQQLIVGTLLISCAITRSIYQDSCVIDLTRDGIRFIEHFYRDDARGMKPPRDEHEKDDITNASYCGRLFVATRRDLFVETVARKRTRDPCKRVSGYDGTYGNTSNDKYSSLQVPRLFPREIFTAARENRLRERRERERERRKETL